MSNLLGVEEEVQTRKEIGGRKVILFFIIISILLLIATIFGIFYLRDEYNKKLKVYIDGKQTKFETDLFLFDNNSNMYVSIEKFAPLVNYEFFNGGYKEGTEVKTECYVKNDNEIATFEKDSEKIYKIILNEEMEYDEYIFKDKILFKDNKLYATVDIINTGFNVKIEHSKENNSIKIASLQHLTEQYKKSVVNAGFNGINSNFKNIKAIMYDMIVVEKGEEKENLLYGVISTTGETIIGTKYDEIQFIENTQEFIVKSEGKYGILSKSGERTIALAYDKIKVLDNKDRLYLVLNDTKYGVINSVGEIIVYLEYDKIEIENLNLFDKGIKNKYMLLDSCIIAKQLNTWLIYTKKGELLNGIGFESIGYISDSKVNNNILTISIDDKINAIVVKRDGYYGAINEKGDLIIPIVFNKIYSITQNGIDTYYMEFDNEIMKVRDYLIKREILVEDSNIEIKFDETKYNTIVTENAVSNTIVENTIIENTIVENNIIENKIINEVVVETPVQNTTNLPQIPILNITT